MWARSLSCSQLGRPRVFVLFGGQFRPTDKAMPARTLSRAGAARLSDEEERLLTKRSIEWHRGYTWETLFEREKKNRKKHIFMIQTVTAFFPETHLPHNGPQRSRFKVISGVQRRVGLGKGLGGKIAQGWGVQGRCYRLKKRGLKNKSGLNNIWSGLKKKKHMARSSKT